MPVEFLYNLTKNLTAHLQHNLCAVLPIKQTGGRMPPVLIRLLFGIYKHIVDASDSLREVVLADADDYVELA